MKNYFTWIFILFSQLTFAQTGSEFSGQITLSGLLKKLVVSTSLPIGSMTGSQGYEVLNYSLIGSEKRDSKVLYCQGGMGLSLNPSYIGIGWGADVSKIKTFGKCSDPKSYEGGFLKFSFSGDYARGNKSISASAAINIGFDLANFNQMSNYYTAYSNTDEYGGRRLKAVYRHLARYLAKQTTAKTLSSVQATAVRLMTVLLAVSDKQSREDLFKSLLSEFDENETTTFKKFSGIKANFKEATYRIYRDTEFYNCEKGTKDCIQVASDGLKFFEQIESSLQDCHSISFTVSPKSDFSLSFFKSYVSASVGYYFYNLEKKMISTSSTAKLVAKEYAAHNFTKRSSQCLDASSNAASALGQYLGFMQSH
jgi:hypothetical protein